MIIIREFQRQYGQDSSVKLIEHGQSTAKDVFSKPSVAKSDRMAETKKSKDTNDNNDNDYDEDDEEYDWEHEYDEAQAEKKARQEGRERKD